MKSNKLIFIFALIAFAPAVWAQNQFGIHRITLGGHSMEPAIKSGESMIMLPTTPWTKLKRGDIVLYLLPEVAAQPAAIFPDKQSRQKVERVIGLPGETVSFENNEVVINGQPLLEEYLEEGTQTFGSRRNPSWSLGPDEYFLLGDRRSYSYDSRAFGPIPRSEILRTFLMKFF